MNAEIKTLTQEFEQMESTFLPSGDLVEEQKGLIKQSEERVKETEKKIDEIKTLTNEIEQSLPKFEETKLEDFSVTTDVKEWLSCVKSEKIKDSLKSVGSFANLDYEIITNAEAYALGPVVSYKGKTLAMEFIKGKNIEDIKAELEGKRYILYIPLYKLTTHKLVDFEFEKLENSELQYGVRCAIL
jgi:hypothetical protein